MARRTLKPVPMPNFDPFTPSLSRAEYDPDQYYISSTNSHDHSTKIQAGFPPDIVTMMQKVVDGDTVYESLQDFIRDAVVHNLHKRRDSSDPLIAELLLARRLIEDNNIAERRRAALMDTLAGFERRLSCALKDDDTAALEDALESAEDGIDGLSEPWKSKLRGAVQDYSRELRLLRTRRGLS